MLVPDGSSTSTAEPVSNDGGIPVKTGVRKGKMLPRSEGKRVRKGPAHPQGGPQGAGAEIPLWPTEDLGWSRGKVRRKELQEEPPFPVPSKPLGALGGR